MFILVLFLASFRKFQRKIFGNAFESQKNGKPQCSVPLAALLPLFLVAFGLVMFYHHCIMESQDNPNELSPW